MKVNFRFPETLKQNVITSSIHLIKKAQQQKCLELSNVMIVFVSEWNENQASEQKPKLLQNESSSIFKKGKFTKVSTGETFLILAMGRLHPEGRRFRKTKLQFRSDYSFLKQKSSLKFWSIFVILCFVDFLVK